MRGINSLGKIINPKTLIIKPNASSQQLWISRLLDGWMELFILRSDNKDPTWAIGQHGQCKIVRGLKLSSKRYLNQGRQRQCTGYKVQGLLNSIDIKSAQPTLTIWYSSTLVTVMGTGPVVWQWQRRTTKRRCKAATAAKGSHQLKKTEFCE